MSERRRHPGSQRFRGSMAGLYAPLPTLRRRPRGRPRTDRGRRGLLLLHRSGLSPQTPCQSPGALTHVTARRIAQPPKAAFVTRLQPCRLPGRTARQLPDQSTTLWVESSSTGDPRLRAALPMSDISRWASHQNAFGLSSDPSYSILWIGFACHAAAPPSRVERRFAAILAADV